MSVIRNLCRDYHSSGSDFKIDIPHWEISDEGITALSGPSGSGKTSVIRLLLGLEACPQLSWVYQGIDLAQLPVEKRRLGVVFQSYELFPHLSARDNIEFAAKARRIDSGKSAQRLSEIAEKLSLKDFLNRPAHVLSGGERQRVALARALIGEPRFLFLDEPFAALDVELRSEARDLVKRVITEFRIPTLLVSHDIADVSALAQQTVKIRDGRLV